MIINENVIGSSKTNSTVVSSYDPKSYQVIWPSLMIMVGYMGIDPI